MLFGVNDYCERTRNASTENILGGASIFPVTLLGHVTTVITGNRFIERFRKMLPTAVSHVTKSLFFQLICNFILLH